jgi:hypothetical protein
MSQNTDFCSFPTVIVYTPSCPFVSGDKVIISRQLLDSITGDKTCSYIFLKLEQNMKNHANDLFQETCLCVSRDFICPCSFL